MRGYERYLEWLRHALCGYPGVLNPFVFWPCSWFYDEPSVDPVDRSF